MINNPNKQTKFVFYLLAFLLPFITMAILLATQGIWWGSDTTILASDGFHQYVIFNQTLRNALHGDGSLFYTFTSGLGLNFYALSSYYLGSFLSPLVFFFDLKTMPDALYLFTLVKFGLTGLSTYISLKGIYQKLYPILVLLLSTSFALMSFSTSQLEINSWLDVFILVPLILLGLDRLIKKEGRVLYFISLTCLFIQNYYFGYMMAIFLTLWFLVQLSWDFKKRLPALLDFTVVSILAGLASLIMILPAYLDLKTHGESFTEIVTWQTENSWYLDIFAKSLIGSFDTTKFGSIPMIFVGILPFLLSLIFFTLPSIKWQVKLSYAGLLLFIIASFYLQPLDLFWQGMHAPNMFLHRYAWTFSLLLIYMAGETLSRLTDLKPVRLVAPLVFLVAGYLLTFIFKEKYNFLNSIQFLLSFEFLLAYLILLFAGMTKKISLRLFSLASIFFVLFEMGLHSHYQIEGLSNEWYFPSRDNYQQRLTEIDSLVKYTQKENTNFYRMETLLPQTGNDSMKYNYNGISQFSSIRNRSSSNALDKLGFRSDGTNLNLRYQNNTLIADSLFGITYNLATRNPEKFGFTLEATENDLHLYKNQYALPLAILTNQVYEDVKFTNLTLDNQTNFLNQLTGLDLQYYYQLTPSASHNASQLGTRTTVNQVDGEEQARVTYEMTIPAQSQLYVSLPDIQFTNENSKKVQIIIDNELQEFTLDNTFPFFNIGSFEETQEIQVTISFPHNAQVSFKDPQFYCLDLQAYETAFTHLLQEEVQVRASGQTVTADYQADSERSLLFTLPYDKGWTATINGKEIPISRAQNGFMKVDVPAGQGRVVLTFLPQGLKLGTAAFFLSTLIFISYEIMRRKYAQKAE